MWRAKNDPGSLASAAVKFAGFAARAARTKKESQNSFQSNGFVTHVALHTTGNNIGDVVLPHAVREVVNYKYPSVRWHKQQIWHDFDDAYIDGLNRRSKGLLIGGHGLLTPDTMAHMPSGWQWNISNDRLRKIEVPLAIFAVGYNRFRNQEDFSPRFRESISLTAEKSVFIGMRNNSSCERVKEYIPAEFHERIHWQPCPTTLLSRFRPDCANLRPPVGKVAALNMAFDRSHLRFGATAQEQELHLGKVIKVARHLISTGWQLHLSCHAFEDAFILPHLKRAGIDIPVHYWYRRDPKDVVEFYKTVDLSIAMRGHAQMIPFGLGRMIIPIITHDKLVFFMKDVGKLEWGTELKQADAADSLISRIDDFVDKRDDYIRDLNAAQDRFWVQTQANLTRLAPMFQ
ncbi:hypothetical protein AUP44_15555 [Tistrella mobilis]|uniref:Polysaccharide pyruvyl transferase domain-containing protein n=1 Tax=Tistrella mobilis TaxID=171437 RepID=A0A162JV90_9PROT|nr:hypothetical protein AUP44_15555 [Tistrella mobilis]